MNTKRTWNRIMRLAVAAGLTTTVIEGGCTPEQINALAVGVGAAVDQLDNGGRNNDDIELGDWLADEFGNL